MTSVSRSIDITRIFSYACARLKTQLGYGFRFFLCGRRALCALWGFDDVSFLYGDVSGVFHLHLVDCKFWGEQCRVKRWVWAALGGYAERLECI